MDTGNAALSVLIMMLDTEPREPGAVHIEEAKGRERCYEPRESCDLGLYRKQVSFHQQAAGNSSSKNSLYIMLHIFLSVVSHSFYKVHSLFLVADRFKDQYVMTSHQICGCVLAV